VTRSNRSTSPEARFMLLVDCPLCDRPAPFDAPAGELDCEACGVRLDVASDDAVAELPLAA
jgi:ribosomal protein S27E